VSVHNGDAPHVLDKEEGVKGIVVANEAKHVVVTVLVRISNSFDDFIFPIDQLQWLFIDTSNY
jgi:hypothetical protein